MTWDKLRSDNDLRGAAQASHAGNLTRVKNMKCEGLWYGYNKQFKQ